MSPLSSRQRLLCWVVGVWTLLSLPSFVLTSLPPDSPPEPTRTLPPGVEPPVTKLTLRPASPAERTAILRTRKVNLNTADTEAFRSLPGVGPETARAILRHRQNQGPFRSIQQLEQVKGIGPATLRKLAPKIKIETERKQDPNVASTLINVNRASAQQLQELPGVGPVTAASIVTFRERSGRFRNLDELRSVPGVGPKTLESLRPEATVGSLP